MRRSRSILVVDVGRYLFPSDNDPIASDFLKLIFISPSRTRNESQDIVYLDKITMAELPKREPISQVTPEFPIAISQVTEKNVISTATWGIDMGQFRSTACTIDAKQHVGLIHRWHGNTRLDALLVTLLRDLHENASFADAVCTCDLIVLR